MFRVDVWELPGVPPMKSAVMANGISHNNKRPDPRPGHGWLKLLEGFLRFIHLP